jgi:DNA-binding CsgD family transcriptional regulator
MIKEKDFFIEENKVIHISDDAYNSVSQIIEDMDAFTRLTYRSFYVIDYYKKNFLYVSDNPLFLCGLAADEVKKMGYSFYINQVVPEDLSLLLEINKAGFQFLQNIPIEEKKKYTVSYDFHIVNKLSDRIQLINHQITPLRLTESGEIWLALCVASVSSNNKSGNITMAKNGLSEYWFFDRNNGKWQKVPRPELKEVEKEVLKLSARGFGAREIAVEIRRSFDTVRGYRKDIFEKLGVDNIAAAISYAKNYRLI